MAAGVRGEGATVKPGETVWVRATFLRPCGRFYLVVEMPANGILQKELIIDRGRIRGGK